MKKKYRRHLSRGSYFWEKNKRTVMIASAVGILGLGVGAAVPILFNNSLVGSNELLSGTSEISLKENYNKSFNYTEVLQNLKVSKTNFENEEIKVERDDLEKFIEMKNFPETTNFIFEDAIHDAEKEEIKISFSVDKYKENGEVIDGFKKFNFTMKYLPSSKMTSTNSSEDESGLNRMQIQNKLINGSSDGKVSLANIKEFAEIKNAPENATYRLLSCTEDQNARASGSITEVILLADKFINDFGQETENDLKLKLEIKSEAPDFKNTKITFNPNIINNKSFNQTRDFLTQGMRESKLNIENATQFFVIDNLPTNSSVTLLNYELNTTNSTAEFNLRFSKFINENGKEIREYETEKMSIPVKTKNTSYKLRTLSEEEKQYNITQVENFLTNGSDDNTVDYFNLLRYVDFKDASPYAEYKLEKIEKVNSRVNMSDVKIAIEISFDKVYINDVSVDADEKIEMVIDGVEIRKTEINFNADAPAWEGSAYDFERAILEDSKNPSNREINLENKVFRKYFNLTGELNDTTIMLSTIPGSYNDPTFKSELIMTGWALEDGTVSKEQKIVDFTIALDYVLGIDADGMITGFRSTFKGSKEHVIIPIGGPVSNDPVRGVAKNAFKDEKEIKKITMPHNMNRFVNIEEGAFAGLHLEEDLVITNSVQKLGEGILAGTTFAEGKLASLSDRFWDPDHTWRKGYEGEWKVRNNKDSTKIIYRNAATDFTFTDFVKDLTNDVGVGGMIPEAKLSEILELYPMAVSGISDNDYKLMSAEEDKNKNMALITVSPRRYYNQNGHLLDNSSRAFGWELEIQTGGVAINALNVNATTGLIEGFNETWLNTAYSRDFKGTGVLNIPKTIDGIEIKGFAEPSNGESVLIKAEHFLKEITFEKGLIITDIPNNAFKGSSSLRKFDFTNIKTIGNSAFERTGFETFELGENTKKIGNSAFKFCYELKTADLNNVEEIGKYAFEYSPLKEVNIPNVRVIGERAFSSTELVNVEIPFCIKTIGERAFTSISKLESLTLPSNFSIYDHSPYWAYGVKESLITIREQIIVEDENFTMSEEDGLILSIKKRVDGKITIPNTIAGKPVRSIQGETVFKNQPTLTEVEILAENMTTIDKNTFVRSYEGCAPIRKITAPFVKTIEEHGIRSISTLRKAEFASLTEVGFNAFLDCWELSEITAPNLEIIGESSFYGCSFMTTIDFPKLKEIGNNAFSAMTRLDSVILPDSLTKVGSSIFRNCENLRIISVPSFMDPSTNTEWCEGINKEKVTITVR
ncbi:MAG: leucine-rich repeat domain-containing protein [Mycoplasma sp.]